MNSIRVVSIQTGLPVKVLGDDNCGKIGSGDVARIRFMVVQQNYVWAIGNDKSMRIWDLQDYSLVKSFKFQGQAVWCKPHFQNPSLMWMVMLMTSGERKLCLFDVSTEQIVGKKGLTVEKHSFIDVLEERLMVLAEGTEIKLFDLKKRQMIKSTKALESISGVKFHPRYDAVVFGDGLGRVNMWHPFEDCTKTAFHWHSEPVNDFVLTADGEYLLSGGREGVLVVWQCRTDARLFLPRLGDTIEYVSTNEDHSMYCLGMGDNSIKIVSVAGHELVQTIQGPSSEATIFMTDPGRNKYLVVDCNGTKLQWVDPHTGFVRMTLKLIEQNIKGGFATKQVAMTDKWLASYETRASFSKQRLKLFEWNGSQFLMKNLIDCPKINSFVFAGEVLIACGKQCSVFKPTEKGFVNSLVIPEEADLIAVSPDLSVIALAKGNKVVFFNDQWHRIRSAVFSFELKQMIWASNSTLCVGGEKGVSLWDALSCQIIWTQKGSFKGIEALDDRVFIQTEEPKIHMWSNQSFTTIKLPSPALALAKTDAGLCIKGPKSLFILKEENNEPLMIEQEPEQISTLHVFGAPSKALNTEHADPVNSITDISLNQLETSMLPSIVHLFQTFKQSLLSEKPQDEPQQEQKSAIVKAELLTPNESLFTKFFTK